MLMFECKGLKYKNDFGHKKSWLIFPMWSISRNDELKLFLMFFFNQEILNKKQGPLTPELK